MKNKLLLLITILTLGMLKATAQVPAYEKAALVALYNSTNGANWTDNTNWNSTQPVSTWFGITVENIAGVDHVTRIDMNNNNLVGTLPTQIGDFPELKTLFLYNSIGMAGSTIPSQITFLSKLQSIAFWNNGMSGVIPAGMSNLQSLIAIYFAGNNFSGAVPNFSTPNKSALWLAQNRFEFGDFENQFTTYQGFGSGFTYFPQNQFYEEVTTEETLGSTFTLTTTVSGTANNYQWYKVNTTYWSPNIADATAVTGATNNTLTITNAQNNDFGYYYCAVTSNNVPNLEIKKEKIRVVQPVPTAEKNALIALYNATDGPNWTNNTNWNTTAPIATWSGVTVANGHVTVVSKGAQNLTGVLPIELQNLTGLITLYVHNNNLSGTIPNLTGITTLQNLAFSNNNYHFADFENEFATYSTLNNLYYKPQNKLATEDTFDMVIGNTYTMVMPAVNGTGVTYQWYKNDVAITGAINLTYNLTNAQIADAADYTCKASSPIVIDLTIDRKMIHLYSTINAADKNALVILYYATTGANWTNSTNWNTAIPVYDWFGVTVQGTRVTGVNLPTNNLVGTLPTQIGDLTALIDFRLNNNQVSGSIPTSIGNLTQLHTLGLQDNQLTGNLPAEIGDITSLRLLYLWNNQLDGTIPTEIGNCTNLRNLSLEDNQFTGAIPVELGNLINLEHLWLLNNQLTGKLHSRF